MHDALADLAMNTQRLRRDAELSIEDAAATAGIARATWHAIEGGQQDPDLHTMVAMARSLGVTLAVLLDHE